MSNQRYPEEFKIQAVNQATEKQLPVSEVAAGLGVSVHSLYAWIKRYTKPQEQRVQEDDHHSVKRSCMTSTSARTRCGWYFDDG